MARIAAKKKIATVASRQLFDTHPEVSLDLSTVRAHIAHGYVKPLLLLDSAIVRTKARRFVAAMPRVRPHYAVKANPHPEVLRTLIEEGTGFEIASVEELEQLLALGVDPRSVFYSNPVKSRAYVEQASRKGVEWFAFDAVEELRKIAALKPDAKLYLRIETPNAGSDWPLTDKFGARESEIGEIIRTAAALKADLAGVMFHVGSQCLNPDNWLTGIERAKRVFAEMRLAGLSPRLLDIGGGFPVRHAKPIPSLEVIGDVVNSALADLPDSIRVIAEPGRYLVSDAGCMVCRVTGTATRGGKRWMYWDVGVFGGVFEIIEEGLRYNLATDRAGEPVPWNVAGPTCDSFDMMLREEPLPCDMQEGDFVYIRNAAAYTTAYASNFNGFPLPEVRVFASERGRLSV